MDVLKLILVFFFLKNKVNSSFCTIGCGKEKNADNLFWGVNLDVYGPLIRQWLVSCLADMMHIVDHFRHFVHLEGDSTKAHYLFHLSWLASV